MKSEPEREESEPERELECEESEMRAGERTRTRVTRVKVLQNLETRCRVGKSVAR